MSAAVTSLKALPKIPFKNVHAQSVPAFGVMQVSGSVVENGVTFLTCTQPGSALGTEFAVNGPSQVRSGEKGICYRQGDLQVAYDGGSPQVGEGWGMRANQWTLSRGYPSLITVHGVNDAANKILYGKFAPFGSLLGKPYASIPALDPSTNIPGSGTVTIWYWGGTAYAASTMTFTGYNFAPVEIAVGELQEFVEVNGQWVVPSPENYINAGVAQADIADSAWGSFIISDGRTVPVFNLSGEAIHNGDVAVVVRDLVTLNRYAIKFGSGATLVRFELTADLVYGTDPGSDNAVLLTYHGGAYHADGAAIRVFDWTNDSSLGTWSGKAPVVSPAKSGYQGYAILKPDRGVYEIVWMEQMAQLISFRLYQHLTTANASQANVPVLSFWNGRDPDPTGAKITVYNLLTDYSGVYKYSGDANAVGYAIWNEKLSQYQIIALEGDGQRWVLVKNSSGYTAPANSVVGVLDVTRDANSHTNKRNILTFERPSTTLHRNYLITGYADIANGAVGVAFSTEGPQEATYDTGTPANGESWGPRPGQFTLSKGFPGFIVEGLNSDDSLAVVRFEPINQLYGQATGSIAAHAVHSSGNYKIYTGALGSEADSGFSAPTAFNRGGSILNNDPIWLAWTNNGWYMGKIC